ncbi:hypothetical protein ACFWXH_26040 [Mesorhizobium sp. NPDC059054]|uniref:hypothetical protein n=1 Tax=Mesorhizobium sp. NPDC059054 TaxID=3346711 RepID=UPI0036C17385
MSLRLVLVIAALMTLPFPAIAQVRSGAPERQRYEQQQRQLLENQLRQAERKASQQGSELRQSLQSQGNAVESLIRRLVRR